MKKFFAKPHNLLFAASLVILLQFLSSATSFYIQISMVRGFSEWIDFAYLAYCLAVCVVSGVVILKKDGENKNKTVKFNKTKLWFAGFFLYAFSEILLLFKMLYIGYADSLSSAANLWDNQPLYRLYLCVAAIFIIYCASFVLEKKRAYIALACMNLFIFGLFVLFMPDTEAFLLSGFENMLEVSGVVLYREAGTVIFMLNAFVFGLYEFYHYKEK